MLKTFEGILHDKAANHPEANKLAMVGKLSFCHKRSCLTNLVCLLDEVIGRIDGGERAETCYLEIKEAFDSVNDRVLHHKAKAFGVDAKVNKRIAQGLKG